LRHGSARFQNGTGRVLRSESRADLYGLSGCGGSRFLLWGEPGLPWTWTWGWGFCGGINARPKWHRSSTSERFEGRFVWTFGLQGAHASCCGVNLAFARLGASMRAQNGTGRVLRSNRRPICMDFWVAKGSRFLLWGEPGLRWAGCRGSMRGASMRAQNGTGRVLRSNRRPICMDFRVAEGSRFLL
jgi:hypothetical protein